MSTAEKITNDREEILNKVIENVPKFFLNLSLDKKWKRIIDEMSLDFYKGWEKGELIEALRKNFQEDMKRGYTNLDLKDLTWKLIFQKIKLEMFYLEVSKSY